LAVTHGDLALGSIVSILLGNGDGTFQAPVNYQTGFGPGSGVVSDFNGDGHQDLAIIAVASSSTVAMDPFLFSSEKRCRTASLASASPARGRLEQEPGTSFLPCRD
jgi:hypothetical protein